MTTFSTLIEPLQQALRQQGYTTPTPIQAQAIPALLEGKDIFGTAQTGTGKTAAFLLPLLQHLANNKRMPSRGRPRALILAPTRELAAQIGDSIKAYGRFLHVTHTVIYGGVGQRPQEHALSRGVDIIVATPGRLLDLMEQRFIYLDTVEVLVLDEADRMLDMGFIHDIKMIIAKLPAKKQTAFFSATMAPAVMQLAKSLVHDPVHITIESESPTIDRIAQKMFFVDKKDKDALLLSLLHGKDKVLVFTQMKHVANKVAEKLEMAGIRSSAIHGNKTQSARMQALDAFKRGKVRVLVATDVAARGIDVDNITHVINYDLPNEPETYVHRIGRTARAGASGDALSFCSAEERNYLRDIERFIKMQIPVDDKHRFHSELARNASGASARPPPRGGHSGYQQRSDSRPQRSRPQRSGARPQRSGARPQRSGVKPWASGSSNKFRRR